MPYPMPGPPDAAHEQRALVALSLVPGIGPGRIRALVARFGSAEAVLRAGPRALAGVPGIGEALARAVHTLDADAEIDDQVGRALRCGAELVTGWDERFPYLLSKIYDPPAFVWVRGRIERARPALAVVGTRRPSDEGRRTAHDFAQELARQGILVVSGLAYGIDTAAHEGALAGGGETVAVLGSGVDRVYPQRNGRLARRIVDQGALVSEFPLGAAPDAVNFPRRNRIISGLAHGTLVVEAYEKGGALITAHLALEQNREVFAVPGEIRKVQSRGTNGLIRDGHAKLVVDVDDILEEILPETRGAVAHSPRAHDGGRPAPEGLDPLEQKLWDVLRAEPQPVDWICERAGLDASSTLVGLLHLEFKGLVRQLAGKQFYRIE